MKLMTFKVKASYTGDPKGIVVDAEVPGMDNLEVAFITESATPACQLGKNGPVITDSWILHGHVFVTGTVPSSHHDDIMLKLITRGMTIVGAHLEGEPELVSTTELGDHYVHD
jgi:hypothetical protein